MTFKISVESRYRPDSEGKISMIQTWLPLPSFRASVETLHLTELSVQRIHVLEILEHFHSISPEESQLPYTYDRHDLRDHPVVDMWRGYELQLCEYGFEVCEEFCRRRTKRVDPFYNKITYHLDWASTEEAKMEKPNWFGDVDFHLSHQSALLRKNSKWYSSYFMADRERSIIWPESDFRAT